MANKLVYGVGINDYQGKADVTKPASCWRNLLARCYSEKFYLKSPSYRGCTTTTVWLRFTAFLLWYEANYVAGWQLDKDILSAGNKIYGPHLCCFVPPYLNGLIVNWDLSSGVHLMKNHESDNLSRPYYSKISQGGKSKSLGSFSNPAAANLAWRKAKSDFIVTCVERYRLEANGFREEVANALLQKAKSLLG